MFEVEDNLSYVSLIPTYVSMSCLFLIDDKMFTSQQLIQPSCEPRPWQNQQTEHPPSLIRVFAVRLIGS